ncbi:FAD-dependent oxidoreductase [Intrasporangium sp.]|uniref:FAD-dependent oxidoreductase n=1 Tax=Intrasporangium sp. TaxID=1925024 RepID=UPI00293A3180|nr:FAD-dependent oxidoreductase [Intrasporangium sp.]MDV3220283.1 FAD-dependent oxidoreductase [Intrasporangium sp.]
MSNLAGRHGSVWLDDPGRRRNPATPLAGEAEADVVVIGAGITGLTTALLAAREGHRVVVLEARRIGDGTTGYTTGKVTAQHSLIHARLVEWAGVERARQYADANRAGIDLVADLVEEYDIDCSLTRADALVYTASDDAQTIRSMEDEAVAARRLALPATLVSDSDLPFPISAGVRFTEQLHLHPRRYLDGLADAVVTAGGVIHESSRATRVSEAHGRVTVQTDGGTVEAGSAVVATLLPIGLLGGHFARTRPHQSYGLAVRLRGEAPREMTISVDEPVRSTRPWLEDGPGGLIVVGGGHEVGADVDTEGRYADLERWARETFDVAEVSHRWSAHDYVTPDRVPYVGRALLHQHVYVATGFGKWGLAAGSAAGLMITDLLAGREPVWLPVFDAGRIDGVRSVPTLVTGNIKVAAELVTGELRRDAPRCSHLGCRLRWNVAEESWDCHCHGSRFASDGAVLTGPAVRPIDVGGTDRSEPGQDVP